MESQILEKWSINLVTIGGQEREIAVADPLELMLSDLVSRYAERPVSESFARLYADDARFGHAFATLHERLNQHFGICQGG